MVVVLRDAGHYPSSSSLSMASTRGTSALEAILAWWVALERSLVGGAGTGVLQGVRVRIIQFVESLTL